MVVCPVSASLGTLIRVECSPGTIFNSLAVGQSLCLNSIVLVALQVCLSGSINVLLDVMPVSSRASSSSPGAVPKVAPVSRMPVFLARQLSIFRAQCAATLLTGLMCAIALIAQSILVFSCGVSSSSCSLTRQVSRDQ